MEKFFRDIKDLYDRDKEFQAMVKKSNTEKVYSNFTKEYISFSAVNKLLLNPALKNYIWKKFSFPDTVLMPSIPEILLYGVLSEFLHSDQFNKVILSNLANSEFKEFISCLSNYYEKSIVEFDEIQAEFSEDII